ncbi:MAG: prolipoprotein diacylglyceryl transferase [Actinomycetota bacterium]
MVASIPSPNTGTIDLGPFVVHMYGLMLLLAIAASVALTGFRYVRRGGDWDLVLRVAVWGVAFGIVGARLYHDVTSWSDVPDPKWKGIFEVWKGGLGVWGGILLGAIAGAIVVKRSGRNVSEFADAAAPGILLAQGIGRIGNWFNQELYGKSTDSAWGVEIDVQHRVPGYEGHSTFQPTFLYELIYDVSMVGLLLLIDWRFRIRAPALFALYVSLYTFGRFFEELIRIDPAHEFAGLRLNAWVSLVVFVCSTAFFIWWQFLGGTWPGRRKAGDGEPRKGPRMSIPKGRVRPSR